MGRGRARDRVEGSEGRTKVRKLMKVGMDIRSYIGRGEGGASDGGKDGRESGESSDGVVKPSKPISTTNYFLQYFSQ